MSSPTIASTPGMSSLRPLTVAPNTTSRSPVARLRKSAHSPWITVASVSRSRRANSVSARVSDAESDSSTSWKR